MSYKLQSKIEIVKQLLEKKLTPNAIAKELSVSRDTVKLFIEKNNLPIYTKNDHKADIYKKFIEYFKKTNEITASRKKYKISYDKAVKLLKENDLEHRDRAKTSIAIKTLSLEEAQYRLPNQEDKVIGFENGKYIVKTKDSFVYYKKSSKLYQGDPRGKSGTQISLKKIRQRLDIIGYRLIDEAYVTMRRPLKAVCLKCNNIRQNKFTNFFDQSCPSCSNTGISVVQLKLIVV